MFLPKIASDPKIIRPVFMVDLINIPLPKAAEEGQETLPPELENEAEAGAAKEMPAEKSPEVSKENQNHLLERLKEFETKPDSVLEQLDQVAKIEPEKTSKPVAKKEKPAFEETFKELDEIKKQKLKTKKAVSPVLDLEEKELKKETSSKPGEQKKAEEIKKEKSAAELLKEFEKSQAIKPVVKKQPSQKKKINPLLQKLASLESKKIEVIVEVVKNPNLPSDFKSHVRDVKTQADSKAKAKSSSSETQQPAPKVSGSTEAGVDIVSYYAGLVQRKVFSNWEKVLGARMNRRLAVAFLVYSGGNIDKPKVIKSSGDAQLDSKALKAIFDSVPFPKFPKGMNVPNIYLTIKFSYVEKS